MFLDPPYDSEFSGYSGNAFTEDDHCDLRDLLSGAACRYLLAIESSPLIDRLYASPGFRKEAIPSRYSYSMRGRNDRSVNYLLIRNY